MAATTPPAVLLDVGGVFVIPRRDAITAAIARAGIDVDAQSVPRAHYVGATRIGIEREPVFPDSWEHYLDGFCDALGVPKADRPEVLDHLRSEFAVMGLWAEVVDGSKEGLQAIVDTGVPVGIVSNADGTVANILRELEVLQVGPGPGVNVRCIIDSGEVGVDKPDPRIFKIALDALGVDGDTTPSWYVGDTPGIDVVGARRAGLHPILFDPFDVSTDVDYDTVHSLAEVAQRVELPG